MQGVVKVCMSVPYLCMTYTNYEQDEPLLWHLPLLQITHMPLRDLHSRQVCANGARQDL
jgi:hypothetical protein